eukprot:Platyproteum_vivax@DN1202_c0_g1_i1.p1
MAAKRLMLEYREACKHNDENIRLYLGDLNNMHEWTAEVKGPEDSPYAGGVFKLKIEVPALYPISPPKVTFLNRMFHPNVHQATGELCLDILKNEWSPVWTLHAVCKAIILLLGDPNEESPLNCDAGNMLRNNDRRGFNSLARMYTIEFAMPDTSHYSNLFLSSFSFRNNS